MPVFTEVVLAATVVDCTAAAATCVAAAAPSLAEAAVETVFVVEASAVVVVAAPVVLIEDVTDENPVVDAIAVVAAALTSPPFQLTFKSVIVSDSPLQ